MNGLAATCRWSSAALAAALAVGVLGCDGRATALLSSSHMASLSKAIQYYRTEKGEWPDRLEQVKPYADGFATLVANPLTGDSPGYEYVKPTGGPLSDHVILYQLRGGTRDTTLNVGYADGSVRRLAP